MIDALNNTTLYIIFFAAIALAFGFGFITKFVVDRRHRKDFRAISGELEVKRVRYKKLRSDFKHLQNEMDHQRVELHKLRENKGGNDDLKVEIAESKQMLEQLRSHSDELSSENRLLKKKLTKAESSSANSKQHKELKKKFVILQKNHSNIKAEFDKLKQSNQVHADYDALFQAHQQLKKDFDLMRLQTREFEIENQALREGLQEKPNS